MQQIVPVILAGGSGTRLWPLSRALYPKQFLALAGPQTLFQQAVLRLVALGGDGLAVGAPLVVGNEEHRFMLLEQLREIGQAHSPLLLEPAGRTKLASVPRPSQARRVAASMSGRKCASARSQAEARSTKMPLFQA